MRHVGLILALLGAGWFGFNFGLDRGRDKAPEILVERQRHYAAEEALMAAQLDAMGTAYRSREATCDAMFDLVLDRLDEESLTAPSR